MSKLVGSELPPDLFRRLEGKNLDAVAEKVIPLCTVDEAGRPHPALLSYFEMVAKDPRNIRLATYKDSTTTRNMRRNGKLTLLVIDERIAYYVKGTVEELKPEMNCSPYNAKLNLRVEQVLADEVDEQLEPGAYVAGGILYKNPNRAAQQLQAAELLRELLE